jgi:serine/threonine-protein phosphatase 2A regulatory subunit B'
LLSLLFTLAADVPASERPDLFIKKIQQCCVTFDFTDALSDLRGKDIKRLALTELVDYISNNRGVITENVYPEIIKMVGDSQSIQISPLPF